jgi:hypothetical protein
MLDLLITVTAISPLFLRTPTDAQVIICSYSIHVDNLPFGQHLLQFTIMLLPVLSSACLPSSPPAAEVPELTLAGNRDFFAELEIEGGFFNFIRGLSTSCSSFVDLSFAPLPETSSFL